MTQKPDPKTPKKQTGPQSREDRLKAALKANLGRRKAQAKARTSADIDNDDRHEDASPVSVKPSAGSEDD